MIRIVLLLSAALLVTGSSSGSSKLTRQQEENFLRAFELNRIPRRPDRKRVEIPEFLIEQYKEQTGMDVDTTNFRKPGALTGFANTLTSYKGSLFRPDKSKLGTQTIVEFKNFTHDTGQDLQAAYIKVYWKPRLSITRKTGSFK